MVLFTRDRVRILVLFVIIIVVVVNFLFILPPASWGLKRSNSAHYSSVEESKMYNDSIETSSKEEVGSEVNSRSEDDFSETQDEIPAVTTYPTHSIQSSMKDAAESDNNKEDHDISVVENDNNLHLCEDRYELFSDNCKVSIKTRRFPHRHHLMLTITYKFVRR